MVAGKLEKQFRSCVPGLYGRLMKRYKRLEERDMAREDSVRKKQLMIQMQDQTSWCAPFATRAVALLRARCAVVQNRSVFRPQPLGCETKRGSIQLRTSGVSGKT